MKVEDIYPAGYETFSEVAERLPRFIEEVYRTELAPIWHDFLADGKAQGYIDEDLDEDVFALYLDILRAGFASRVDMIREWRNNMPLLEKMTRLGGCTPL